MKKLLSKFMPVVDVLLSPFVLASSALLAFVRKIGVHRMPWCKKTFMKTGVFPILDHYGEPFFNPKYLRKSLREERFLPGIDFNIKKQLAVLEKFNFNDELIKFPIDKSNNLEFYYNNSYFETGDAEYLYNIIRLYKPKKIIEIGSGNSTLMAINAIKQNKKDNHDYLCEHICVEPYERKWLEETGVNVVKEKVETIDKKIFASLSEKDILFIDSSHIIRPQGDVLFEYLEILPVLKSGVFVHIHDIFTPRDYLDEWIVDEVRFMNEQYLLEAFLTFNEKYKIIGALNYLYHNYFEELSGKCPALKSEHGKEPHSFWMAKC